MRNYPEWMLIYWACVSMGVAVVGMNAWWVTEELEYAVRDSAPKVIFCDQERLTRILERPGLADGIKLVAVRAPTVPPGVRSHGRTSDRQCGLRHPRSSSATRNG